MSATEHDITQNTERAERPVLLREFVAGDVEVEGRMVDVRLVPFGEVARVADPPDWREYQEEWLAGCFDHQMRAPFRIQARYGHSPHAIDVVGHGTDLRREADGYHVTAEMHKTPQAEATLALLHARALPCVSLEARAKKTGRSPSGVVQRIKADLTGFAFCVQGAFAGAQVLAIREEPEQFIQPIDEDLLPVDIDPARVERLRRQGIALPDRYTKAHPAQTDTPPQGGTSDDGTRQTQETASSEE